MRSVAFLCVLLGFSAGCGAAPEADGTSTEQEQLVVGWTSYVSEEQPAGVTCGAGGSIRAAACRGSYCDDVALYCAAPHSRNLSDPDISTVPQGWWPFISEESPNNQITCGSALNGIPSVIDGIRTTGSYSDNISVHCAQLASGHGFVAGSCEWTPWFSEETGTQWFPALAPRIPYTKVAVSVRCRGSYCDDMSYEVCEVQ